MFLLFKFICLNKPVNAFGKAVFSACFFFLIIILVFCILLHPTVLICHLILASEFKNAL